MDALKSKSTVYLEKTLGYESNPEINIINTNNFMIANNDRQGDSGVVITWKGTPPVNKWTGNSNNRPEIVITWKNAGRMKEDGRPIDFSMVFYNFWIRPTSDYGNIPNRQTAIVLNPKTVQLDAGMFRYGLNTTAYSTPEVQVDVAYEIKEAGTDNIIPDAKIISRFIDIDQRGKEDYGESITLMNGWNTNTYISNDSILQVLNDGATYKASNNITAVENNDNRAHLLVISTEGRCNFQWRGKDCGTQLLSTENFAPYPLTFGDLYAYKSDIEHI